MKKADEAIGKVMAGLGRVEASSGFEERMVRRVRAAAQERGGAGWFGVWRWVGVGCVGVLVLGVGVGSWREGKRGVVATHVGRGQDARMGSVRQQIGAVQEGVSQRLTPRSGLKDKGTAEAVPLRKTGFPGRAESPRQAGSSEIAEVSGAGFPAPPMPLTEQERLLLRVAHRAGPDEVAMLDRTLGAFRDVEETTAFQEFFGKPEKVEQTDQQINQGETR